LSAAKRVLIVNADDFGLSRGVNAGVIKAYEHGIVTSASLMVRWSAAAEAAAYARASRTLSLGLHVDLGESTVQDGVWVPLYEVVSEDEPGAVEAEVRRQLESFRKLVGRDPTHLDSHQHAHRSELEAGAVMRELADRLGVPLRDDSPKVRYDGCFYGQTGPGEPLTDAITVERLIEIVSELPAGVTELSCHPGEGNDIDSLYRSERELEVATLCDRRVRAAIEREGVALQSFSDLT
jgi:chitin disaccharide deacetylase